VLSLLLRILRLVLGWILLVIGLAWAMGALWFDFPVATARHPVAITFLVGALAALIFVRPRWRAKLGVAGGVVLVGICWFTLQPSNDRPWQPDVAETAWAEINGDEVTLHNVRNSDYRTETDYTPRWETRMVRLSQMTGIDIAITYWGSPWIAHPIASFQFADAPPLCFSAETRKEVGESYSAVGGLYRQYELIYIAADESDLVRLRTNFRQGEDVYLYRTLASPAKARERFLEYLKVINDLHRRPRWYNAVTTNCTTAIRAQRPASERVPWDWRILANGKMDEMMYERHGVATGGLPFAELKQRSHINGLAHGADSGPAFSAAIRKDLPGRSGE
jgi:hypothetical protein